MNAMMFHLYLLTWFPGVTVPQLEMVPMDENGISIVQGFKTQEQCEAHGPPIIAQHADGYKYFRVVCNQIPPMP